MSKTSRKNDQRERRRNSALMIFVWGLNKFIFRDFKHLTKHKLERTAYAKRSKKQIVRLIYSWIKKMT